MERGRAKLLSRAEVQVRDRDDNDAIYVILPTEMRSLKDMRIYADAAMLSTAPLWSRVDVYLEFYPNVDGINKYLRTNLFSGSKRCKRDEKAAPIDTTTGKLPRGRPRKGTRRSDEQLQMAAEARKESVRITQRQSKQRGRCENRLLALFFACLYNTSDSTNPLTAGIPPLYKTVTTSVRSGGAGNVSSARRARKTRKISNYPSVRIYLRKLMCELISLQAIGIRTIVSMGSPIADLLPSGVINIIRTFLVTYYLKFEAIGVPESSQGLKDDVGGERAALQDTQLSKAEVLSKTMESVVLSISDWWRRNYTPDNQLTSCENVTRSHPLIAATENLMAPIVELSVLREPGEQQGDESWLYGFGCAQADELHNDDSCSMCKMSRADVSKLVDPSHRFVEALTKCNELIGHCSIQERQDFLRSTAMTASLPLWNEMYAQNVLHRMQTLSDTVKKLELKCEGNGRANGKKNEEGLEVDKARLFDRTRELVQTVRFHVGKFCNAVIASNENTVEYMRKFVVQNHHNLQDLVYKVVFSASVGAEVLLENEKEISELAERLFAISKDSFIGEAGREDELEAEGVLESDGAVDGDREATQQSLQPDEQRLGKAGEAQRKEGHAKSDDRGGDEKNTDSDPTEDVPLTKEKGEHVKGTVGASENGEKEDDEVAPEGPPTHDPSEKNTSPRRGRTSKPHEQNDNADIDSPQQRAQTSPKLKRGNNSPRRAQGKRKTREKDDGENESSVLKKPKTGTKRRGSMKMAVDEAAKSSPATRGRRRRPPGKK